MFHDSDAPVQIGEILAGKYRVDRVLGVGGMGVVVAATHLQLDQLVALKFVRREALRNPEIVSRFEREARAAVRLKSEHVARIIDVGRLESGSPYIVMEYLEGQDLAALLAVRGPLPVPVACDYLIQACDAIAEAHSLGIVHRDLKPGNLFLANTSHGRQVVKVLDFGISKSGGPMGDANMTRTQAVMGSPGYMSPEQMRSTKNVDGRTDVWSLGVILYELVAGRVPFEADTFTALCLKIAMDPLPPLASLPLALPPGFDAVVNRALEKDPGLRLGSAVELAHALAPFAGGEARDRALRLVALTAPSGSHHSMPTLAATSGVHTLSAATGQRDATVARGGSRRLVFAGAGVVVAAIVGIALAATRGGPAGDAARPAAVARPEEQLPAVPPHSAATTPPAMTGAATGAAANAPATGAAGNAAMGAAGNAATGAAGNAATGAATNASATGAAATGAAGNAATGAAGNAATGAATGAAGNAATGAAGNAAANATGAAGNAMGAAGNAATGAAGNAATGAAGNAAAGAATGAVAGAAGGAPAGGVAGGVEPRRPAAPVDAGVDAPRDARKPSGKAQPQANDPFASPD
jgi:serine/threonine-protein kinase